MPSTRRKEGRSHQSLVLGLTMEGQPSSFWSRFCLKLSGRLLSAANLDQKEPAIRGWQETAGHDGRQKSLKTRDRSQEREDEKGRRGRRRPEGRRYRGGRRPAASGQKNEDWQKNEEGRGPVRRPGRQEDQSAFPCFCPAIFLSDPRRRGHSSSLGSGQIAQQEQRETLRVGSVRVRKDQFAVVIHTFEL